MQRLFSSMGNFFVQDKSGNYYPATFLTWADGTPVVNSVSQNRLSAPYPPNQLTLYADRNGTVLPNPKGYLVVPSADFMNNMAARGEMYGQMLKAAELADQYDPDSAMNARAAAGLYRMDLRAKTQLRGRSISRGWISSTRRSRNHGYVSRTVPAAASELRSKGRYILDPGLYGRGKLRCWRILRRRGEAQGGCIAGFWCRQSMAQPRKRYRPLTETRDGVIQRSIKAISIP